ncbi:MAG: tetratricopeptide repeat protein [bacterium]|nr:tetratricopeptide repeat protein [bacterium]
MNNYKIMILLILIINLITPLAALAEKKGALSENELFNLAAQLYVQDEDKTASMYSFDLFLKRFPESKKAIRAQFMIGECLSIQQKKALLAKITHGLKDEIDPNAFRPAIAAYEKIISKYPDSDIADDARYRIGECYFNQKEYDKAIPQFQRLIDNYPRSYLKSEALLGIAQCYLMTKKWKNSQQILDDLIKSHPAYQRQKSVIYALGLIGYNEGQYEKALELFNLIDTPGAIYYAGKSLEYLNRPLLAIGMYKKLIENYPENVFLENVYYLLGEMFYLCQDYTSAMVKYQEFIQKYPRSELGIAAKYKLACIYLKMKDYSAAIDSFETIIRQYPKHEIAQNAQFMIGVSRMELRQYHKASFDFGEVVNQYPTSSLVPDALYKIGWCYLKQENHKLAASTFQRIIEQHSNHPLLSRAYLLAGNCYYMLRSYDKAVAAYKKVLDQSYQPELHEAAIYLINRTYYAQKDYEHVISGYHYMLNNLSPSKSNWRAFAYLMIAEAYYQKGDIEDAKEIYETIIRNYPESEAVFYAQDGMIWYFLQKGEYKTAFQKRQKLKESFAREKLETTRMDVNRQYEIANGLFNQKKYAEALEVYESFIKDYPDNEFVPEGLYREGLCYYQLEYYREAIDTWERLSSAYKKHPSAIDALYKIADTYFRAQEYNTAITTYQRIINNYPKSPNIKDARLRIGQSYYNAMDDEKAIAEFQGFINTYPDDQKASDALSAIEASLYRQERKLLASGSKEKSPDNAVIDMLRNFIAKYPKSKLAPEMQFHLAQKYFDLEQYAQAAEEFSRIAINYSDSKYMPDSQYLLGESLYELGRYEESITVYQRLAQNFPNHESIPAAMFHLGTSFYNLKRLEEAVKVYQNLTQNYPNTEYTSAALFNTALCYKKMDKLDETAAAYRTFCQKYPDDDMTNKALIELAAIYRKQENFQEAIKTLAELLNKVHGEAALEIIYNTGDCYLAMQNKEKARLEYLKLKDASPKANSYRLTALTKLGEIYEEEEQWTKAIEVYEDIVKNTTKPEWKKAVSQRIQLIKDALK